MAQINFDFLFKGSEGSLEAVIKDLRNKYCDRNNFISASSVQRKDHKHITLVAKSDLTDEESIEVCVSNVAQVAESTSNISLESITSSDNTLNNCISAYLDSTYKTISSELTKIEDMLENREKLLHEYKKLAKSLKKAEFSVPIIDEAKAIIAQATEVYAQICISFKQTYADNDTHKLLCNMNPALTAHANGISEQINKTPFSFNTPKRSIEKVDKHRNALALFYIMNQSENKLVNTMRRRLMMGDLGIDDLSKIAVTKEDRQELNRLYRRIESEELNTDKLMLQSINIMSMEFLSEREVDKNYRGVRLLAECLDGNYEHTNDKEASDVAKRINRVSDAFSSTNNYTKQMKNIARITKKYSVTPSEEVLDPCIR